MVPDQPGGETVAGPRSPRGRRAKGNLGERTVKAILEKQGFPCVNGAGEEPGVDLWFNPEGAIEVKNQPWSTIGGTKRQEMLAAAIRQRQEFRWHWVITHEASGWQVAEIGRTPEGKIGLLYKQPIEFFERGKRGLRPEEEAALAAPAQSRAESGAAVTGTPSPGKSPKTPDARLATSSSAAPPAMQEEPGCDIHIDGLHRGNPCACGWSN